MARARAPIARALGAGLLALLGALSWGACENDARDSHCSPDTDDARCLFAGDGRGPGNAEARCALPDPNVTPPPADCPSFGAVIDFMSDPQRGNCAAVGCHGTEGTAAIGIYFPLAGDTCATYKALFAANGSIGRPYLRPDDPSTTDRNEALDSWMYCNVLGLEGGGYPMPKPGGVTDPAAADLIRDFILCGAPADGCDVTGAGAAGEGT